MKHRVIATVLALILAGFGGACSEEVPPGYVGMRMDASGLDGQVLQSGRHSCWGRCRMLVLETQELTTTEELSVLCRDDLNFKFDLKLRSRLRHLDGDVLQEVLANQGSRIQDDKLAYQVLYDTYVKPVARSTARTHVSKYMTTEIRENREVITKAIRDDLIKAVEGTPVEIVMVVTSNFDYPDVITRAVEQKRTREIQIEEERAKQAMELLRADNRMKIAQKMKAVRAAEAEAEAAYNRIVGKSLSNEYLRMRQIEGQVELYRRAGSGDKVIVTDGQVAPLMVTK